MLMLIEKKNIMEIDRINSSANSLNGNPMYPAWAIFQRCVLRRKLIVILSHLETHINKEPERNKLNG